MLRCRDNGAIKSQRAGCRALYGMCGPIPEWAAFILVQHQDDASLRLRFFAPVVRALAYVWPAGIAHGPRASSY